jgi:hypothetical protein
MISLKRVPSHFFAKKSSGTWEKIGRWTRVERQRVQKGYLDIGALEYWSGDVLEWRRTGFMRKDG